MFEFLQHYSANKSKLFALCIEILYSFTLLFFACQIYGVKLSFDELVVAAKSISVDFFITVIGIGLTYLIVAIVAQLIIIIGVSLIISELSDFIIYKIRCRKLKDEEKSSFTIEKFKKEKETVKSEGAYKLFSSMNEKQFVRNKDYYLGSNATLHSGRIFIIFLAYLIIRLGYQEVSSSVLMNCVIVAGLLGLVIFYNHALELETIVSSPNFFKDVEERRMIKSIRQIINGNKYCYQKKRRSGKKNKETVIDNLYFILNKKGTVIAWIIIIDGDWIEDSLVEELLKSETLGKGSYKILVDVFDLIPDKYIDEKNLKIVKSIDAFNLNKDVTELLIEDRNKSLHAKGNTSSENSPAK